jgi:hypothetical protein
VHKSFQSTLFCHIATGNALYDVFNFVELLEHGSGKINDTVGH